MWWVVRMIHRDRRNTYSEVIYTQLLIVDHFKKINQELFNLVKKRTGEINLSKQGQLVYKELLSIFEKEVKSKLKENFGYLLKDNYYWPGMGASLLIAYVITTLIIKEKFSTSQEEAIYEICNNKKYGKFIIQNWDDKDIMHRGIRPAILLLPIKYLTQLKYGGRIKNKEIYGKVKSDFELYSNWYKNFKIITEEQFNDPNFDLHTCEYKNEASLKKSIKKCPDCGSDNLSYNVERYEAVCNGCGMIIEG